MSYFEKLKPLLRKGAAFLEEIPREGSAPLIVAHYDADGLAAASIIAYLFTSWGIDFHLTFIEQLYPDVFSELPLRDYSRVLFLDLGSGYKDLLANARVQSALVVDHHPPHPQQDFSGIVEVNPYLAGIDASAFSCAASVAFAVAMEADPSMKHLAHIAVVGALGDRMDNGDKFSLTGLNSDVLEIAKQEGIVEESIGLRLFGPKTRPIVTALAATMDPFIPGLSGSETAAYNFLRRIGIEPKEGNELRTLGSLTKEEEKLLATELVKHMVLSGVSVREAQKIVGYNYYLAKEPPNSMLKDLREYAYLLNALGRMEQYSTAVALNMGYKGKHLARAEETLKHYRRLLAKYISLVESEWHSVVKEGTAGAIAFLEGLPPKLTGSLCSVLSSIMSGRLRGKKFLGVAARYGEGKWKISFRRLSDDVNLGDLLRSLASKVGGVGGGHPAAGGLLVDENAVEKLLMEI